MSSVSAFAVLIDLGRARLAMADTLGAIDLFWATVRAAAGSCLVVDPDFLSPTLREELLRLAEPARPFPCFVLQTQGPLRPVEEETRTSFATLRNLLARALGPDGVVQSWPAAEVAWQYLVAHQAELLSLTDAQADGRASLDLARAGLDLLVSMRPPNRLEPRGVIGQHAEDKNVFVVAGAREAPLQDAGWAYDKLPLVRGLAAIAEVLLAPVAQGPYLQQYAEQLFDRGHVGEAEVIIRKALSIAPTAEIHNALLRYLLASPHADEAAFFAESRRWAALYAAEERLQTNVYRNIRVPERPLNVGYMCDFIDTALAEHTLVPLFEEHDRSKVRVAYYNHGPDSPVGRALVDTYRNINGASDEHIFDLIKGDAIDILVDLNGRLRVNNRYDVLCRKPAPIQVNWYNLLASTGLKAFDFIVTDEVSLPKTKQHLCTEEIVHVTCQVAGSWRLPEEPTVAPLPVFHKGVFVFACFGNAFKLNERVLGLWVRLMHEVPEAMLYLKNTAFYTPEFRDEIHKYFADHGIFASRLRLENGSRFHKMRALYAHVDLCLDTFPYGNGSTTINALWQGVPTLTLATDEWRGRTTASIMKNAGLHDFVVTSLDEYIEKARWYASHPQYLASIRSSVRGRLKNSGYYNIDIFARDLEAAYRQMWLTWLARSN